MPVLAMFWAIENPSAQLRLSAWVRSSGALLVSTVILSLGVQDVVIPIIAKDLRILPLCLEGVRRCVAHPIKQIYIVAPSQPEIIEFCDKYPIRVIPNGVDTKLYHPAEERNGIETANAEGPDTVQLLTVSRLIARKGMQDLIPEIRWLENRTGRNICWTIAGDGPYRSALEMLASECDVEDRIVFAGRTDGNETAELYRSADIFAFPSYKEGMPNAVLEAMASGLPVVMKRSCQGAAELVRDNGALSDESFADALAEVIEGGRKRWREMGAASRRIVNEEFTWEHISERYLNLLGSIISDE